MSVNGVKLVADNGSVYTNPILADDTKSFYITFSSGKAEFIGLATFFPTREAVLEAIDRIGLDLAKPITIYRCFKNFQPLYRDERYSTYHAVWTYISFINPIPAGYIISYDKREPSLIGEEND